MPHLLRLKALPGAANVTHVSAQRQPRAQALLPVHIIHRALLRVGQHLSTQQAEAEPTRRAVRSSAQVAWLFQGPVLSSPRASTCIYIFPATLVDWPLLCVASLVQ